LPLSLRGNICLLQSVHPARVRGNINRGEKPHISFYHVRYTSHRLARSPQLIGKTLRIYYSADDIRTLRAFLADGTELGELKVGGIWATTPHSLDIRQRIFRAKRLRQLHFGDPGDPVEAYLQFKRGRAKRSRQAASEIAQIKAAIDTAKRKSPAPDAPNAEERLLPLAVGPVKSLRLRIPSGFV
jgi:putative transposase